MAAYLLTAFVEHPIVFLGYSLQDSNIQKIVGAIARCLSADHVDKLRDRLIFVQWNHTWDRLDNAPLVPTSLTIDGVSVPVLTMEAGSFLPVYEALSGLRQRFPARLLRQLKEQVYELVRTGDPAGRIYVSDIEDDAAGENVQIVFGVGAIEAHKTGVAQLGYSGIDRDYLLRDLIEGGSELADVEICRDVLPRLFRNADFVPAYKYLRRAEALDAHGHVDQTKVDRAIFRKIPRSLDRFTVSQTHKPRLKRYQASDWTIQDIIKNAPEDVFFCAGGLDWRGVDPEVLRQFIVDYRHLQDSKSYFRSYVFRLASLYDYLKYGPGA